VAFTAFQAWHRGPVGSEVVLVRAGPTVALTARAGRAIADLVARHPGEPVVVGSHGTFVARALVAFGVAVDWSFSQAMPMPAVYRLRFPGPEITSR